MMLLRRWMRVASRRGSAVSANESVLATLVYRTGEVLYDFFRVDGTRQQSSAVYFRISLMVWLQRVTAECFTTWTVLVVKIRRQANVPFPQFCSLN